MKSKKISINKKKPKKSTPANLCKGVKPCKLDHVNEVT